MSAATPLLLAMLIASILSITIMACDDGGNGGAPKRSTTADACATAAAQFEANPNDATAMQVRNACHME